MLFSGSMHQPGRDQFTSRHRGSRAPGRHCCPVVKALKKEFREGNEVGNLQPGEATQAKGAYSSLFVLQAQTLLGVGHQRQR